MSCLIMVVFRNQMCNFRMTFGGISGATETAPTQDRFDSLMRIICRSIHSALALFLDGLEEFHIFMRNHLSHLK